MDDDQTRAHDDPSKDDLAHDDLAHDDLAHDDSAHDDPAFARLRAADPAGGPAPDLAPVYAAVTAATGVDVGGEVILVDQLSSRRARRAPRWLQAAAIVAGMAVIGGGSYAVGGARADTKAVAEPAMSLENGGSGTRDDAASSAVSGAPEAAVGSAVPPLAGRVDAGTGVATDGKLAGGGFGFGRTVFASHGLSTQAGSAPAYGFDAVSTYTQATVEHAAAALGVTGTAHQEYGQWLVGPNDGTGPSVTVSSDGSVSYYDPTRDPWSCLKAEKMDALPPEAGGGSTGSGGSATGTDDVAPAPSSAPDICQSNTDRAPSGKAAVRQAKDTMSALGVDPAGFEFESATDESGGQSVSVAAFQVVDGQRSGLSWNFTVVASGVQSLYGTLAPTVSLGDYDVVSPTEAVTRLGDPRFGAGYGGVMPMAADARFSTGGATPDVAPGPSDEPTVPATPEAGSPLAWPVEHVTIVSARLGLALTTLADGASVLVPTYELADADGTTWTVVAVADTDLDFSS
ncbi:hypothetical protein [Cellulomonas sp. URHD0024]|uniref:hypothetical protein n=1 Tax=Cellulomonas sp. URHD0024 TaxID=1302620 RepID=UPI0003FD450D|nr:hypothetical protein [Cellulomonas sp. URHD0024]